MSKFNQAFNAAARRLMNVFGDSEQATYRSHSSGDFSLLVMVDRGVKNSDVAQIVNASITISWMKEDMPTHSKKDKVILASGESFQLSQILENDGVIVTYQVIKDD